FINTVSRKSFLITLILVPLLPALILFGINLFGGNDSGDATGTGGLFQPGPQAPQVEGYIDQAGIILELPEWIDPETFIAFDNEEQANTALESDEIQGYYVIEADILETGSVRLINKDFNPFTSLESSSVMESVLRYNLLGANAEQFAVFSQPLNIEVMNLSPETVERDDSSPYSFFVPYITTLLLYVLIITSASLMMTSVTKEKENRVIEILLSSISPRQLLIGKILGLALVGLLQTTVWMGAGFLMLRMGGTTLNIPANLQLPADLLIWSILFFLLGYFLYATIMAGVGALVPNVKEASQATIIIILPMLIPLTLISMIISTPNATLPLILSLFPFSAPVAMVTRMSVTSVPIWQILTAIGLMLVTIILLVRAVSGMFRAQVLLTGKKFSLGLYLRTLFGKESKTA
ncbi:MAG: ABC transporter permease, partial [Anaerolineaceae bacterium]|nr:ABC transporter permease [Anaerolineaceae bacterium]